MNFSKFLKKVIRRKQIGATLFYLIMLLVFPAPTFATGECPQARKTKTAPGNFLKLKNPLPPNSKNIFAGKFLYQEKAKPIACKTCHGEKGNGKGDPGFESTPAARNFTCAKTMKTLSDGQLFWLIKKGSQNTSMFSFSNLSNDEVWQLIHYIRQFAK